MIQSPTQWVMSGRTYDLNRFTPLTQITAANIARLAPAWSLPLGATHGEEGNPIVIGTTMYISTSFPNHVTAIDLTKPAGAPPLWRYTPEQDTTVLQMICCGAVNRGLAYHPPTSDHPVGILYLELLKGDLLALDARTGAKVFQVTPADVHRGETLTGVPMVVRNVIILGVAGGEYGVRGRVVALSAMDGHEIWRAYNTGPDADVRITPPANSNYESMRGKDLGETSWPGDAWTHGGAATWGWFSYDPELDEVYYGSGLPAPWNAEQRAGDNKWAASIFARNPETGAVQWVYQMTPHDRWSFDGVNEMQLAELPWNGRLFKALIHFDHNGIAYTIDRGNGKVLVAAPFVPVTWTSGVDLTTGRPVEPAAAPNGKALGDSICPATVGGKGQQPSAYSPRTRLFYVPTTLACMSYQTTDVSFTPGQPFVGATVHLRPAAVGAAGAVIAWDPIGGHRVWTVAEPLAVYSGVLVTASDIVFYGTLDGWLKAVDATSGKALWRSRVPAGVIGNPVAYRGPDGREYIAILSGTGRRRNRAIPDSALGTPVGGLTPMGVAAESDSGSSNGVLSVFALEPASKKPASTK